MENNRNFKLIEGQFTVEESRELLFRLYNSKIRFHKIKNMSAQERFGKDDVDALRRSEELASTLENILDYLKAAEISNETVAINAEIKITFLPK